MTKKDTILMLTSHKFPTTEAVLENVFSKELGCDHKLIWFLQGKAERGQYVDWNNTKVILYKSCTLKRITAKLLNSLNFWIGLIKLRKLIKNDIKIVFVRDNPFLSYLLSFLKDKYGFRLFYQHSAPLGDLNIGYYLENKKTTDYSAFLKGHFFNLFLKKALLRSDLIFPITSYLKDEMSSYLNASKIVPLTMGVDEDWISIKAKKSYELEEIKKTHYIIAYIGTLNFLRNPQFFLEIMALIRKKEVKCKLLMIGKTDSPQEEQELKKICLNLGLKDDVIFTGYISRVKLKEYLSYCDLTLSAIPPTNYYTISSPTKVYESLGNSVPVIGNSEIYEQERVLRESGGGVAVKYTVESFVTEIIKLLQNKSLRKQMSISGKAYTLSKYSYKNIAREISHYFD